MNRHITTIGAAAALGVALSLAPVMANAAPLATPTASSAPQASGSSVTSVAQRVVAGRVVLTVQVSQPGFYSVRDAAGHEVDARQSDASGTVRLIVFGSGKAAEQFTVVRDGETATTPVTVSFGDAALPAPIDQSSVQQIEAMNRAVLAGDLDQTIGYTARPGATVRVTVNGVTTSGVAGADGIATVTSAFAAGENAVSVVQTLNGVSSTPSTYGYHFS
ncbi:hypothetical protein ACLBWP_12380 [Microbacterium sp. M1A1_1b]